MGNPTTTTDAAATKPVGDLVDAGGGFKPYAEIIENSARPATTPNTAFAKLVDNLAERCGGLDAFAETAGISTRSAQLWTVGRGVPTIRTLVRLADTFGYDLAEVLTAAGRPPSEATRARLIFDGTNSLALRITAWLDANNLTNKAAAEKLGIDQYTIARLANGARIRGAKVTYRIAAALGTDPVELARTDGTDELVAEMTASTRGFAGMLRTRLDELGVDHFDPQHVAKAAKVLGIGATRFRGFLKGREVANLTEAVKIAELLHLELAEVLTECGVDASLAQRWADAATSQPKYGPREELGVILRAYRLVREMSTYEVAEAVGYSAHSAVVRVELDGQVPSPENLTRFADALDVPLGRLFAAAGYHRTKVA